MKLILVSVVALTLVNVGMVVAGTQTTPHPIATASASPSVVASPSASATETPASTPEPTATARRTPGRTPVPTPPPQCNRCTLSGRVYTSTGQLAPKTSVTLYSAAGALIATTTADASAFYSFTISPGKYKLFFNPAFSNLAAQWFNGKSSLATADVITVDRNVGINPALVSR